MNYYMIRYECDSGCGVIEDLEPGMEPPDDWECNEDGDFCSDCGYRLELAQDDEDESPYYTCSDCGAEWTLEGKKKWYVPDVD